MSVASINCVRVNEPSHFDGAVVASVGVSDHSHSGIVGKHSFDPQRSFICPIRYNLCSGMN